MAPPPFQQQGPVAMSRATHAQHTPTQYRQQHSYTPPQQQQQPQHAPPQQYQTYRPPQQEQEEGNHESNDSNEDTEEEEGDDDQHADQGSRPMFSGQAHHSLAYERAPTKYADPSFANTPYRPPPGAGTVPVSSTSQQRKNAPVVATRSMVEPTPSSARPIPVPPSRSATHHEFNASVGVGLGSSPSSGSRMPAHYPTTSNSSFGAGSYGSGSDRGSLGDRGAKHRPPVHDEWRATDAAVVSSSPATTTTKPQRWIPPANASPPSTPSALPRQPSIEALRTNHPSPIAPPSTSPTASTLRREASSTGLRNAAHAHTHAPSLSTVPELGRAPSTPSPVVTRKEKIWQPPASEYEREHQEAAANLREQARDRERERDREHEGTTPLRIPQHKSSTMSIASTGTPTRTSRPGSSASVYLPGSPAQYSPVVPASPAVASGRPPSMYPSSVASSNRDSIFSAAATGSSYTSSGTAFLHGHTISESPPSSPQLFPHGPNALHPPPRKQSSMSQPARPRTPPLKPAARTASPGAPLASVARDLADDAEEWVRVLRAEHVERFEAQKKLAQLELEAKILDIAKREAEAIVHGNGKKDEFDAARERAREDFTQQMETLAAIQDGHLREAIASAEAIRREGGGPQNVDIWEENLRAEQEIIMQQIARERRASVGNDPPSSAGPSSSRQATSSSTTGASTQRRDDEASPEFLERNAERRASGLQRQREEVEARERQIAQEREEARRREAALTEAARKRDAAAAEAVQQRRLDEVQRQQAAARSSTSSPRTPQRQGSGPIPIPARSRKATVQSESDGDTEPEDDDEVQEEEDASSSSDEEQAQPRSSRAPSRNPTLDSPSPAPTAAPVHSRPQPTRQGSAAIDIPAPKTQRKA
ncbi:hypothetical protein EXIGLDRAFT_127730 [Exidia glandulosa HHB12029]|uniref:Uncharacterized protein n=1 Tax=Exidia glandulosa HHB12029 TaxID=1314781 RepID=A0A166AAM9_EXIGL|nr:hypothetical protein EXIGLDRAFT_127730 [Exidia glandulosa HHB12029]